MSQRQAVVIVLREQERVLLIRRAAGVPRPGVWSPPTGRVEPGETLVGAVVREAREELGIAVRALREVWQSDTDDGRYRLHWWEVIAIDAPAALRPDPAEVAATRWASSADWLALQPTFPQHRRFFEQILPRLLATG
jgi:8-oxo-dGTP diphosphatase